MGGVRILDKAREVLVAARRRATAHARVEGRRVFVSDAALCKATGLMARAIAPAAELSLEPAAAGFVLRMLYAGRPVSGLLVVERLAFERGQVRVDVRTPRGIDLRAWPRVALLAGTVRSALGGTRIARRLLARATPPGVAWDGKRAELVVPTDRVPVLGRRLGRLEATARVARVEGGVWLEVDRDGVARDVLEVVLRSALDGIGVGAG